MAEEENPTHPLRIDSSHGDFYEMVGTVVIASMMVLVIHN